MLLEFGDRNALWKYAIEPFYADDSIRNERGLLTATGPGPHYEKYHC